MCEEHLLRAKLDLDRGRLGLASSELEQAYLAGLHELRSEGRADLLERVGELEQLLPGCLQPPAR